MLVIAIVHIACVQFEARREEIYLLGKTWPCLCELYETRRPISTAHLVVRRLMNLRLVSRLSGNPHLTFSRGEGTLCCRIWLAHTLSCGGEMCAIRQSGSDRQ